MLHFILINNIYNLERGRVSKELYLPHPFKQRILIITELMKYLKAN